MSDAKVFVGVDSGGTRTNVEVRVEGPESHEFSYEVGEALSGALVASSYGPMLRRLMAPLEAHWQNRGLAGTPVNVFVSAAGYSPSVREDFMDASNEVLPTLLGGGIRVAGFANDAVSLLLGHDADGVIIAGTGSNVLVRSRDLELHQIGGHEWVACDYGSGFWIGLNAIRKAYRDWEEGDDTVLLQRLHQEYGIREGDEKRFIAKLRDLAIADKNLKREISRFATDVCGAAERGDLAAQNIVKTEAEDLADVTSGALRRYFDSQELGQGISLVQCGSLLGNAFYNAAFQSQVERRLLTGAPEPARLEWSRYSTGTEAAVNLASRLDTDAEDLIRLALAFRPLVVRF